MKVSITSKFNESADEVWELVKKSNTLLFVTRGLMSFKHLDGAFPDHWQQGNTEKLRIMLFGVIPAWRHQISFMRLSEPKRTMLTHEAGGVISTWNHLIEVTAIDDSHCSYTDHVEIKAGLFTPLIWAYAHVFYRYRQRRWRSLLKILRK